MFDLTNSSSSSEMFFCRRLGPGSYIEIGSERFLSELKASSYRQILVYVHGFNNLPEDDIFPRAIRLQGLADHLHDGEVLVVPAIWPCEQSKITPQKYWNDQKAADQSSFAFARVLERFMEWREAQLDPLAGPPCLKRINILAHSMGNRVLRESLCAWKRYDVTSGVPLLFRNIFMVAADVVNETLHRGKDGDLICDSARNVTVYYASDDIALRGSKVANVKNGVASRRLGHSGPEDMALCPGNVFAVDCDDVNWVYDSAAGHAYFLDSDGRGTPGSVFKHILQSVKTGRVETSSDGRTIRLN